MRIGAGKIFCFFNQHRFRVALCTRFFCREVRILEVGSVAGLARCLSAPIFGASAAKAEQENIAASRPIPNSFVSEFNEVMSVLHLKPPEEASD